MKVTKTPNPDTIEYFRDFEAQVRIDFSEPDCEPSIGGIKMRILDSNDNKPVFDESTKILSVVVFVVVVVVVFVVVVFAPLIIVWRSSSEWWT